VGGSRTSLLQRGFDETTAAALPATAQEIFAANA
jgi:hypothetical protein